MQRKLLLGLVLSVAVATSAFAQSSSKSHSGSNSRGSNTNTSAMAKKNARMQAKEESKIVRQIAKTEFGKIKLTKEQKKTLASLVHAKFEQIQTVETQINASIPADKTKALGKAYRMATKEGKSKSEAMAASMIKAGISDTVQQKVISLNASKKELFQGIRDSLVETLTDKQKTTLAEAAAMSEKKMMSDKEGMKNKESKTDKKAMSDKGKMSATKG